MAKKKHNNQPQAKLSPEKYIRTKARSLHIEKCIINKEWKEAGEASVIVVRQHKSGNRTLGVFLIDTFCLGIKDAFYRFNQDPLEYEAIEERFKESFETEVISYNEAHNIIYGALDYAEDLGIEPGEGFDLTQYILEEDTEEIPLIEYEFGRDGKPFLMVKTQLEASKYLPSLIENAGLGNFEYVIESEADDDDSLYESDDDDDDDDNLFDEDFPFLNNEIISTEYNYQYPDYPTELTYKHKELDVLLERDKNKLERSVIDSILVIDRDELLADLENILLYEIGRTCGDIPDELWDEPESDVVTRVLLLLGELRAVEKLDLVLEVMRQNQEFKDFHFGDLAEETIPLTLYYVSGNNFGKLLDYMKEPSLEAFQRLNAPATMVYALVDKPERREEIIEWFRELLLFYLDNTSNPEVFDSTLVGMIMQYLIEIKASELLPEIEELYDTEMVDIYCCGDYDEVKEGILSDKDELSKYKLMDINERYEYIVNYFK